MGGSASSVSTEARTLMNAQNNLGLVNFASGVYVQ